MLNRVKRNIPKLLRFGVVGLVGTSINFLVYYAMTEFASISLNISAIGAFCVAVSSNYIFNHQWTFRVENENRRVNLKQFIHYFLGNLVGLLVNLFLLNILVAIAGIQFHLFWQMLGIACGMMFNFVFAKRIVFPAVNKQQAVFRE